MAYKVKAELKGSGMFSTKKTEQVISVLSAPLPAQPLPHLVEPLTAKVKACCCFNTGSITVGARVENTNIGMGEPVGIDFACKNNTTQGIDTAEAHITEEVRWSAGGRTNYAKRRIASGNFRPTGRWEKQAKEEARHTKRSARNQTDSHRNRREAMYRELYRAISDGENRSTLRTQPSARHSHHGQLYSIGHRLTIKVHTGCCVDNPKIKMPVHIGTPSKLSAGPPLQDVPGPMPPPTVPVAPSAPPASDAPATPSPYVPGTAPVKPIAPPPPSPYVPVVPSAPPAAWADDEDTPLVTATPVTVSTSAAVMGGAVVEGEGDGPEDDEDYESAFATVPVQATVMPTLANLLKELEFAVNPRAVVQERIKEEEWKRGVFDALTPSGFASVVKAVSIEFDQPEVAAILAPVAGGGTFSSEFLIAALRCVSSWLRVTLVEKLLPFCKDLDQNSGKILLELSEWERICTQKTFEDAAKGSADAD